MDKCLVITIQRCDEAPSNFEGKDYFLRGADESSTADNVSNEVYVRVDNALRGSPEIAEVFVIGP